MVHDPTRTAFSTNLVHAGERKPLPPGMPVSTPIYATSTFTYDSMAEVDRVFAGEQEGYVYSRYGNPTVAALEEADGVSGAGGAACAYKSGIGSVQGPGLGCELSPRGVILSSEDPY